VAAEEGRNEAQTWTARGASKQAAEKFDASLLFADGQLESSRF
jgi:hypothetical protein